MVVKLSERSIDAVVTLYQAQLATELAAIVDAACGDRAAAAVMDRRCRG